MTCPCGSSRFRCTGPNQIGAIMTSRGPLITDSPFMLEAGENPFACVVCDEAAPAPVQAELDRLLVSTFRAGESDAS